MGYVLMGVGLRLAFEIFTVPLSGETMFIEIDFNFVKFVGRMQINSSDAFHDFDVLLEYRVHHRKAKLQKGF
ncbi:MAG: hypothetical protein Q7R66_05890 [Undibacterium sp.]|nr:hypothetical protein [Undibacterium sp.]